VGQESVVDAALAALAAGEESPGFLVFFNTGVTQIVCVHEKMLPKPTSAIFTSHEVLYSKNVIVFV